MTTTTSFTLLLAPLLLLLLAGTDAVSLGSMGTTGDSWVFNNGVTVNGTTGDLVAQGDLSGRAGAAERGSGPRSRGCAVCTLVWRRLGYNAAPPTPKIWNRGLTGLALCVCVCVCVCV